MFDLLPYFWMAFMLAVVLFPTVLGLMARPKRKPKSAAVSEGEPEGLPADPVLDFGDELAQMEK